LTDPVIIDVRLVERYRIADRRRLVAAPGPSRRSQAAHRRRDDGLSRT